MAAALFAADQPPPFRSKTRMASSFSDEAMAGLVSEVHTLRFRKYAQLAAEQNVQRRPGCHSKPSHAVALPKAVLTVRLNKYKKSPLTRPSILTTPEGLHRQHGAAAKLT